MDSILNHVCVEPMKDASGQTIEGKFRLTIQDSELLWLGRLGWKDAAHEGWHGMQVWSPSS